MRVDRELSEIDLALCVADCECVCDFTVVGTRQPRRGDEAEVRILELGPGQQVSMRTLHTRLTDIVLVPHYVYRSASGIVRTVDNARMIFLADRMPRGSSGAPICIRDTENIVGLVHGNAARHAGLGVAFDIASFATRTHLLSRSTVACSGG